MEPESAQISGRCLVRFGLLFRDQFELRAEQVAQVGGCNRLEQVTIRPEFQGPTHVDVQSRAAQYNNFAAAAGRVLAKPMQDVESAFPGHFEVQENEVGFGAGGRIGKRSVVVEKIGGFVAVVDFENADRQTRLAKRMFNEEAVILGIVHH